MSPNPVPIPVSAEISPSGTLKGRDWKKLLKGLGIALVGAALTYAQEAIPGLDLGVYTGIAVAVNSALTNLFLKFVQSSEYIK